jgi:hypothetical protein
MTTIPTRSCTVWADRLTARDIEAILGVAESWSDDVRLHVLSPYRDDDVDDELSSEHPWSTEWTGVAIVVHGAAVLVPVVGEWPFGPDRHADDVDFSSVTATDLLTALQAITIEEADIDDAGRRFSAHDASMQRILDVMLAHAHSDARFAPIIERCDDGMGELLCEMGMDEHGLPVLFMESDCDQYDIDVEHSARLALSRAEPLCLTAKSMGMDLGDERVHAVVLTPVRSMESLETMNGTPIDTIEIIRILRFHASALAAAGIPAYDEPQEQPA